MTENKEKAPDLVGSEAEVQRCIDQLCQRIINLLAEAGCSVSAADMIIRRTQRLIEDRTIISGCDVADR